MLKIIIGLFKRLICFPTSLIMYILILLGMYIIPYTVYWLLTGRDILADARSLLTYATE